MELAPPPSSGFYSRLFVVWKTAGLWRPVIDLSLLNRFVDISHFRLETIQSVLVSLAGGLDGLHRSSGGVSSGSCASGISSLPTLCGSLSRLPIHSVVLRSVHGPAGLHSGYGSCICCSSFLGYPYVSLPGRLARPGIVLGGPPPGSRGCLVPLLRVGDCGQPGVIQLLSVSGGTVSRGGHRRTDFSGFSIARSRLQAAVYLRRILSSAAPPASLWQSLLEMLSSSLSHLVPGVRLRMSSLQICLHRSWDRLDPPAPVPWSLDCLWDFRWWLREDRFSCGVSPAGVPSSGLLVRRFRRRLGDSLGRQGRFRLVGPVGGSSSCQCQGVAGCASRSPPLPVLSVRDHGGRVLRHCHRGPLSTQGGGAPGLLLSTPLPRGSSVGRNLFVIRLAPQFIPGIRNVLADSLSRPHQLPSSEWSLNMDVFRSLQRQWPVMIDLCATFNYHRCSIYFSPYRDPLSAGTDALLQSWAGLLAYAFPPWSILPQVLAKLRCLTGPSSPSSPSTGLSVLGSWTSSSCRWLLQ